MILHKNVLKNKFKKCIVRQWSDNFHKASCFTQIKPLTSVNLGCLEKDASVEQLRKSKLEKIVLK